MALFQKNNRPQKSQSDWTACEYSNSFFCCAVAAQMLTAKVHEQKGSVLSVCWHWMQLQWSAACERAPDAEQDCCITILAIDFLVLTSTLRHTQINDVARMLPMFV